MNVLEVTTQVTTLSERVIAIGAREGPLLRVLAEVVAKVATLFEERIAVFMPAFKVQPHALALSAVHTDHLVPVFWHSLERLAPEGV